MGGFRSLGDEEEVEFECKVCDKGFEATSVTGVHGKECQGSHRRPMSKKSKHKKVRWVEGKERWGKKDEEGERERGNCKWKWKVRHNMAPKCVYECVCLCNVGTCGTCIISITRNTSFHPDDGLPGCVWKVGWWWGPQMGIHLSFVSIYLSELIERMLVHLLNRVELVSCACGGRSLWSCTFLFRSSRWNLVLVNFALPRALPCNSVALFSGVKCGWGSWGWTQWTHRHTLKLRVREGQKVAFVTHGPWSTVRFYECFCFLPRCLLHSPAPGSAKYRVQSAEYRMHVDKVWPGSVPVDGTDACLVRCRGDTHADVNQVTQFAQNLPVKWPGHPLLPHSHLCPLCFLPNAESFLCHSLHL